MKILQTILCVFAYLYANAQIQVDFVADQTIGCEVLNVSFTDLTSSTAGDIISWDWDIGNVQSNFQNPGAILNQTGTYTICLTVIDQSNNTDSLCKENYIVVHPNPLANFDHIVSDTCSPTETIFSDLSTSSSSIIEWTWDVGGSANIINTQDPDQLIFTNYVSGGSYTVSLLVTDENGCTDIITKSNLVDVTQSPEPLFSVDLTPSCELPIIANFNNLNIETGVDYQWDFGNGQNFSGPVPSSINFENDGPYLVTLTASREACNSIQEIELNIATDPQLDFQFPEAKCIFNSFLISSLSNVSIDSVIWMTDTGLVFKGSDQTKISIDEPGCYFFNAIVYINGCKHLFSFPDCVEIKDIPDLDFDIVFQDDCLLPFSVDLSVDLPESTNVKWLIESPQGVFSLTGIDVSFEFTEEGIYGLSFEYIEGGACTHNYTLDDIEIFEFKIIDPVEPLGGCIPVSYILDFEVNSSSPLIYHEWTIPELGLISNNEIIEVSITEPGEFNVIYIVENEGGCRDTLFLEDYISGGFMPITDMQIFPVEQCADDPFQFIDESSDFANQWYWQFSDSLNEEWIFGQELLEIITDTGWIDVYHTAGHFGCFGDTILVENAIHILGPGARFTIEQPCNSQEVLIIEQSIAADSFYFQITQGLDTILVEQDSFWFTFNESGLAEIELFTFNDSTGCEMNLLKSVWIPDFDLNFNSDISQGCSPLEVTFNFQNDPDIRFQSDYGEILALDESSAIIRYDVPGAFPSPYLLRERNDCIDTLSLDSIYVNRVEADFSNDPVFCAPANHILTNSSESIFGEIVSSNWLLSPGNLFSEDLNPVFYIDQDTIYHVNLIVEDSWGCKDTLEKPYAIKPRFLEAAFISQKLACIGQDVQFNNLSSGTGLVAYHWDFGDGNTSDLKSPTHSYDEEGEYQVCLIIFDNINCSDTLCIDDYIEIRNPVAAFEGYPLSIECPPLLSDFTNLSSYATDFTWDFGDNSGLSFLVAPSHIYSQVGTYDVMLVASNQGMCPDTLLIPDYILVDGPRGEWTFEAGNDCIPLDVTFTGSSDGAYRYVWDFGNGELTSPSSDRWVDTTRYAYNDPGIYIPKLLLDNNAGCIISVSGDTIFVNDMHLDVNVGDSTFCVSPGIISIDNQTTSSGNNILFTWEFSNGVEYYLSDQVNPEFSIINSGEYQLSLIAETENCIDSLLIEGVHVIEGLDIIAIEDSICYNEIGIVKAIGNVNYFDWFSIQGEFLGSADSLSFKLTESQDYYVVAHRESCPNDTAFTYIEVYEPVLIDLEKEYVTYGNSFPQVDLSYSGNYIFNWFPSSGGLSCLDCPEPFIMPDTISTYFVKVTDLDSGCMTEGMIHVRAEFDCVKEGLHTPNIFSPNGDAFNDGVRVHTQRESDFISLSIFDRWGNLMFFSEDITQSWDGIYMSQPAITGVYILKIQGVCSDSGEEFVIYRDVTLVR